MYTGVSLSIKSHNINIIFYDKTRVEFYNLNNSDINYYIDNHNPFDKAGSYGIQDWSGIFIKKIDGCFNNVVGFPLSKFYKLANNNNILKFIIKQNQKHD